MRQARIDRPVDKRRASHPLAQAAFKTASLLRQPLLAQAVENGLKLGEIRRIVAPRRPLGAGAGDGEGRIERETSIDRGTRLVQATKLREGGGQLKICIWKIPVGLDRSSTPRDRLLVTAEVVLRHARVIHPAVSQRIAWAETRCLGNVSFCFFGATDMQLTKPNKGMGGGEIGRSNASACSHWAMPRPQRAW